MPEGRLVWAIGDVHGRADLLGPLLAHILKDMRSARVERPILVGLGDYIDRGPASKDVIDQLLSFKRQGVECCFLLGNHEESLLTFLADPSMGPSWCDFGGRETLWSYGIEPPSLLASEQDWQLASQSLAAALPPDHLGFLEQLELSCEIGDYFFVHAGVRPGVPLNEQDQRDLLWIRTDFLNHGGSFPKTIVHGHTPSEQVFSGRYRIGVDTGAYATSVLSAVRLFGERRDIAAVRLSGGLTTVEQKSL